MRKRTLNPLPEPEKQTLLEMYRHHPKSRMRERAHMVLLSSQKRDIKEVCSIVFRSENTVSTWLNAYESMGFLGLYDGDIPGRPSRLDKDQQEQILHGLMILPAKRMCCLSWSRCGVVIHLTSLSSAWTIIHPTKLTL